MQRFILSKLVSRENSESFSDLRIEDLNAGKTFSFDSPLCAVEGQAGVFKIGEHLCMRWTGNIFCTSCANKTKKLVNGYCFSCLSTKAEADSCVMSPHLCHYLRGTCRESDWGLSFCFKPHIVYLSYTGEFKVGITRLTQVPVRWFDQGATWAVPLALVGSRHQAGAIEAALATQISDRTVWQKMLKSGNLRPSKADIDSALERVRQLRSNGALADTLRVRVSAPPRASGAGSIRWLETPSVFELNYPHEGLSATPQSLNFEKSAEISGTLLGIKGQYLMLDQGVFNVRRSAGYEIEQLDSQINCEKI